jgi:hypothetical protein
MKKKRAKTSFLAAFAIFFSTSIAIGQEAQQPLPVRASANQASANVTIVPKQPARKASPFVLSGQEKAGIENTVRKQLAALSKGNADVAFANLSPSTQQYFAKPADFLNSITQEVPPITNASSFSFLNVEQSEGQASQPVLITDEEGRSWLAHFQVERQPSGDWRVKGCVVEDIPGQQA